MNNVLRLLVKAKLYLLVRGLCFLMYKTKGKNIKSVKFLKELNVWEFKIGDEYYLSSGPGWAYDYDYLLDTFKNHLGNKYLPKQGDIVIDVGAGTGEEMMIFSKLVGKTGKVYAFEAHPKTFEALSYNKRLNNLDNVELLNLAISDENGFIKIQDSDNSLANKVSKDVDMGFEVEAITIDSFLKDKDIKEVDFLKVNIEGAEQLLIQGMKESLGIIKNMAISCHDFRYMNEGDIFFKTKKIVTTFLEENNVKYQVRETNNPLIDDYIYTSS